MEKINYADSNAAQRLLKDAILSIVLPAFNLERVIKENITQVYHSLSGKIPFEIIAVDDGSSDNTAAEILAVSKELDNVRPLLLKQNVGKGGALKRGFELATGNYVLFLDADLDLPPEQICHFFEVMEKEEADVVIGSKRHPESTIVYPLYRKIMSNFYYFLVRMIISLPIRDTQTGIKLFRRKSLEYAMPRILVKNFAFDLELLSVINLGGFKIAESPVTLSFRPKWYHFRPSMIRSILVDTLAIFYRMRLLKYYQSIINRKPPIPSPLISVIIACPGHSAYLDECIEGLSSQTYRNFEVILLPDESTNKTWPDFVEEYPTGAIRPAEKRNLGITKVRGKIIAFIDDDAIPLDDWLESAVMHFSDTEVAAVGGPATTPSSEPWLSHLGGTVFAHPLVSGNQRYRYVLGRMRYTEDLPSCNLLVRTAIMKELGGFRSEFWPGEDTYLCMEITRKLKKKIIYDPRVHVVHHRRKLFVPHLRQVARYALHRGYFARRFASTSLRFCYFVPSLFVVGLILGGVVSFIFKPLMPFYFAAVAFYLLLTFIASFTLNLFAWLLVWIGIMLTHLTYGIRFIQGFLSPKMPGRKQTFDHPFELTTNVENIK